MRKRVDSNKIRKAILREIRDFLRSLPSYTCPHCKQKFFDPEDYADHLRDRLCEGEKKP